jgi:Flp pilus assembly protein TadD
MPAKKNHRSLTPKPGTTTRNPDLLARVSSLMQRSRWRAAITRVEKEPAALKNDSELLWHLGWAYFKIKNWAEAENHISKSLRLAQNKYSSLYALGAVYLKQKRYRKAERTLHRATLLTSGYRSRGSLAFAYLAQGKINDAERVHRESIKLNPTKDEPLRAYAAFLFDVGRKSESAKMEWKATEVARANRPRR